MVLPARKFLWFALLVIAALVLFRSNPRNGAQTAARGSGVVLRSEAVFVSAEARKSIADVQVDEELSPQSASTREASDFSRKSKLKAFMEQCERYERAKPSYGFKCHKFHPDLLEDWGRAQLAIGLPNTAWDNIMAVYSFFGGSSREEPSTRRQKGSCHRNWRHKGHIIWSPIQKVGSESITENVKLWLNEVARRNLTSTFGKKKKCKFTFVREPVSRFRSGYREFEFRFDVATRKLGLSPGGMTFSAHKIGSERRVRALVEDILEFRWYGSNLDTHINGTALEFKSALAHLFPASCNLIGEKWEFVGLLEDMAEDWRRLTSFCSMDYADPKFLKKSHHVTSRDPQKLNPALSKALAVGSPEFNALYALFRADRAFYSTERRRRQSGGEVHVESRAPAEYRFAVSS